MSKLKIKKNQKVFYQNEQYIIIKIKRENVNVCFKKQGWKMGNMVDEKRWVC